MALSNCNQCTKLFQNALSRTLCPECYGQRIFGRKQEELAAACEIPDLHVAPRLIGVEHALRCEVRADEGRAHKGSVRWGKAKFW